MLETMKKEMRKEMRKQTRLSAALKVGGHGNRDERVGEEAEREGDPEEGGEGALVPDGLCEGGDGVVEDVGEEGDGQQDVELGEVEPDHATTKGSFFLKK